MVYISLLLDTPTLVNETFSNNYLHGNVLQGQGIYLHLTVVVLDTGNGDFIVKSGFLEWGDMY